MVRLGGGIDSGIQITVQAVRLPTAKRSAPMGFRGMNGIGGMSHGMRRMGHGGRGR